MAADANHQPLRDGAPQDNRTPGRRCFRMPSNELEAGTEIYLLDETRLLAKVNDREFKLFERRK